jgi:hypothetical protein
MKEQVNSYNFGRISSRMAKKYGSIEMHLEGKYKQILSVIEGNLLKANRNHGINNGNRAIEAIHICLLMIDGYLNRKKYDLDPYISDTNKPYLNAFLMCFDPFSNEQLKPVVEERCDIHSEESLCEYFEAPVKAMLRIEKSIGLRTKQDGNNGYFSFLEKERGKFIPNEDRIDCIVVTQVEKSADDIPMQDWFSGMNMNEVLTELFPTISDIFKLGFIPSPDELYELTQEQYSAYQRKGGDISKTLYTIIPKNYKYLGPSNEVSLLTREDTVKLGKAAMFLHLYAKENGCASQKSEDILKFAAERLPVYFTKDSKYERLPIKALEPGEVPLTAQEEFSDLLAHIMGEGTALNMTVTYQDTGETEDISIPIEKKC